MRHPCTRDTFMFLQIFVVSLSICVKILTSISINISLFTRNMQFTIIVINPKYGQLYYSSKQEAVTTTANRIYWYLFVSWQYHKNHYWWMVKVKIVNIKFDLHFVISINILKFEKLRFNGSWVNARTRLEKPFFNLSRTITPEQ